MRQWQRIESVANSNLSDEAKSRVLAMLAAGRIHAHQGRRVIKGINAAAFARSNSYDITIVTDDGTGANPFVDYAEGDLAFVLAHEIGHIRQYDVDAALGSLGGLLDLPRSLLLDSEADANSYACQNATGIIGYGSRCR